jgi:DMSO/TMAO reductase YedYZ heme-binding membrane subunit
MTNGWRLTGLMSLLLAAMSVFFLISHNWDVEGLRLVIRATARTSLVLFLLAFTAGAMAELVPGEPTRWQRRNRRYLGVSFAVSHAIHLAALFALARIDADLFWKLTNIANITLAGAAYVLLAAMTATSFDHTAAWLGVRRWRLLHLIGGWYIWISFAVSVGKRLPQGPIYWAMFALVLAAAIVRLVAMSRRNRRQVVLSAP